MVQIMNKEINKMKGALRYLVAGLILAATQGYSAPSISTIPMNLYNKPLFLQDTASPNIVINLDDSYSMIQEVSASLKLNNSVSQDYVLVYPYPDGDDPLGVSFTDYVPQFHNRSALDKATRSSSTNSLYYNPSVTYQPWVDSLGQPFRDSDDSGNFDDEGNVNIYESDGVTLLASICAPYDPLQPADCLKINKAQWALQPSGGWLTGSGTSTDQF